MVKAKAQQTFTCSNSTKYYSLTKILLHFSANQRQNRACKIKETRNPSFCVTPKSSASCGNTTVTNHINLSLKGTIKLSC